MTDLINRADAIEAVRKELVCDGRHETHDKTCRFIADVLLSALPSAEAVQIPIKLEKRYPESKDEDITDAFMRGYLAGRSSAEAVQGEWIHDGSQWENRWVCDRCGHKIFEPRTNFCPNCGAKMMTKGGDDK